MTWILGINAYHGDSSAALICEGNLVAAAEEERFTRIKHFAGFPANAIKYCLKYAGLQLGEVNHIAFNSDPSANIARKFVYSFKQRPSIDFLKERLANRRQKTSVLDDFKSLGDVRGNIHRVEHHLSHLCSAFLVSPFDHAAVVSVDGFGDFASAAWGIGEGGKLRLDEKVFFPHSLGIFYMAMTQYCGFPNWGDEYKVMGLAPYGKPIYLEEMRKVLRTIPGGKFELDLTYFRHHKERVQKWPNSVPVVDRLFTEELEGLLGTARGASEELTQHYIDVARSAQARYEEVFFEILHAIYQRYRVDDLTLAGGCAMNSVANGRVHLNTPFKRVYIQSAAGDAGGAIGAALAVWMQMSDGVRPAQMEHAYWGPEFSEEEIASTLKSRSTELEHQGCTINKIKEEATLCAETATAIAAGMVVGWFQGRMEWGPRALGNRSIVCDPRRRDIKDLLNLKIKRRESFRPFAPSILREFTKEWFEHDGDVPFMMQVYQLRQEKRLEVPAITHVDGSGRLQTVTESTNPRYYKLISSFHQETGVPMVLNTSFNENEPVVCTPQEALDCFIRTKMDVLVLGDWIVRRG